MTDYLQMAITTSRPYSSAASAIAGLLREQQSTRVVDLCSGAGGPWPGLRDTIEALGIEDVSVVLTDLHPNGEALKRVGATGSVRYYPEPVSDAIGRVANDDTAFPHRDALGNIGVGVDWATDDDPAAHIAWIRDFWTRVEPFTQGFYSNDGAPDMYTESAVARNYRGNLDRLVRIKRQDDPTNLFRLNANVPPA